MLPLLLDAFDLFVENSTLMFNCKITCLQLIVIFFYALKKTVKNIQVQ